MSDWPTCGMPFPLATFRHSELDRETAKSTALVGNEKGRSTGPNRRLISIQPDPLAPSSVGIKQNSAPSIGSDYASFS